MEPDTQFASAVNDPQDGSQSPVPPAPDLLRQLTDLVTATGPDTFPEPPPPYGIDSKASLPSGMDTPPIPDIESGPAMSPPAPKEGDTPMAALMDLGDFPLDQTPMSSEDMAQPDMSAILPQVQKLDAASNPVSIDELRKMIETGSLGNAATDPYGDRMRTTIRRLVRGM